MADILPRVNREDVMKIVIVGGVAGEHPLQPGLVGYQRMSVLLCLSGEAMSLSPTVDCLII